MRALFLNCLHAKIKAKLYKFILEEAPKTDIFCFQEFDKENFNEMGKLLGNFKGLFWTKKYINNWDFVQAIFVNKKHDFKETSKDFQSATIKTSGEFLICNIHGVALPGDKKDTPERLDQSKRIIKFAKEINLPTIIGGDFNLSPDTKSVSMFEEAGYKNLIREFGITSTRNRLAWQRLQNDTSGLKKYFGKQYFADYVFTSPGVKIKSFNVPKIEISDHLPMILEFEL